MPGSDFRADAWRVEGATRAARGLPLAIMLLGGALALSSWLGLHGRPFVPLDATGLAVAENLILALLLALAVGTAQRASRRKQALEEVHRHVVAAMDERLLAEDQLRASEERFRQVVEHIGEVVWLSSVDTKEVDYVSPAYETIWGRSRSELYENPASWLDAIHPDDRETAKLDATAELVDGAHDRRYRIIRPDGAVRWIRDRAFPIADEKGVVRALAGLGEDVTVAHEREQALSQAREELEHLVKAQPDLFLRLAHDGTLLELRPGHDFEAAVSRRELIGRRVHAFIGAEDAAALDQALARLRAGSEVEIVEYAFPMKDRVRRFEARLVSLPDQQYLALVRDCTERHEADMLLKGERAILEMVASKVPLADTLTACCRLIESLWPDCIGSVLLHESAANRLQVAAGPSLPEAYIRALDELAVIGPTVGSCGTAAFRKEPVVAADIASDPLWRDYREITLSYGLRACWSHPMLDKGGDVLGTFAIYHRTPKVPSLAEHSVIERLRNLATIAIEMARAEKAVRTSEATYRRIVETSSEGLWEMDAHDTTVFVNARMAEMLGYTVEEMLGVKVLDFMDSDERPIGEQMIMRGRQGLAERSEIRLTKKDGSHLWVLASVRPLYDDHGNHQGGFGMMTDITERRRMEETLRLTQFAVDRIADMTFLIAPDGRFLDANQAACRRLGYTKEELVRLTVPDVDPDIPADAWPRMWKRLQRLTPWRFEVRHRSKEGEVYPVEVVANYVEHEGRSYSYVIGRDITEQRRARAALEESEGRLRLATEAGQMGTWDWDLISNRLTYSTNLLKLFGLPADFLTANWGDFLRAVHPDDRARFSETTVGGRLVDLFEFRSMAPDGTVRWLANRGVVHHDEAGRPIRVVGIVSDVSARKLAELEREELLAEVRVANAMLTGLSRRLMDVQEDERRDLSRDLHDELGQCLTTVKINLQLLAQRSPPIEREPCFEDTVALLDHMLGHVNRLCLQLRPTLLDDLGLGAALRWYVHRQAERGRWAAQFDSDELPSLPERIQVVCFRLVQEALTNVMRHASAKTVRVELRERGGELVVRVEDDGIGFDRSTTKRAGFAAGGLGLLGMQERLRAVGGELLIDSRLGRGTVLEGRIGLREATGAGANPVAKDEERGA